MYGWGHVVGALIVSYLLGSIPTGYWTGLFLKGIDIRKYGSGNLGATNTFRVLGRAPGLFTLLFDVGKGMMSIYIAKWIVSPGAVALHAGIPPALYVWVLA